MMPMRLVRLWLKLHSHDDGDRSRGDIEVGIYEASLIHLSPFWV